MTLVPPETPSPVDSARRKASSSSFYSAMRLMPKEQREAMFAIYGFCRLVDDIADDGIGTRAERHAELVKWRVDLDELYAGNPPERAQFLAEPVKQYGLRKQDFLTVVDGMDMDVAEDIVAPDLKTLDLYCERVASSVGRLSIKVFGMDEGPGFELAHHLGRALQLTNILRDLDEDAGISRLYLQVAADERIEDWSEERIWAELQTRLGNGTAIIQGTTPENDPGSSIGLSYQFEY